MQSGCPSSAVRFSRTMIISGWFSFSSADDISLPVGNAAESSRWWSSSLQIRFVTAYPSFPSST